MRRHVTRVHLHGELAQRHEQFFGRRRHHQTMRALLQAARMVARPEQVDLAVGIAVGLQTLEHGKSVLQSAAGDRYRQRSEEHTSELQSLMRISYAVFCLKKKKQKMSNHSKKDHEQHKRRRAKRKTT